MDLLYERAQFGLPKPFFFLLQNSNVENLPPHILRLVYKEVSALAADPPEGIKVYPSEEDITELHTSIEGPGKRWRSVRPKKLALCLQCVFALWKLFEFHIFLQIFSCSVTIFSNLKIRLIFFTTRLLPWCHFISKCFKKVMLWSDCS